MTAQIRIGDALELLRLVPESSIRATITSPPYWGLRDYGHEDQIGQEKTPNEFVAKLVEVFEEVRRVTTEDGTLWINIGDTYARKTAGSVKEKDLAGVPWRLAFALQEAGWYLRQDVIWHKPNVMPESIKDRCTRCHEYFFMFTKSKKYHYDHAAILEPVSDVSLKRSQQSWKTDRIGAKVRTGGIDVEKMGTRFVNPAGRNKRSVWTIPPARFSGAHFAVMPEALVEPALLASTEVGDLVLDPFAGAGTVGLVAMKHGRDFLGLELNADYADLAGHRLLDAGHGDATVEVVR